MKPGKNEIHSKVLHKLEIGWNDRLAPSDDLSKLRMVLSSTDDVKKLISSVAVDESADLVTFSGMVDSRRNKITRSQKLVKRVENSSAFDSIASTFGFVHHEGTDRVIELKVLKHLLNRETVLDKIIVACQPWIRDENGDTELETRDSVMILDYLSRIRDITVDLVEMVCAWRLTMPNVDPDMPRPFMWEGQNYLLKLISDLDFLADIKPLVKALGISPHKLRVNPLMLPNPLSELSYKLSPSQLASHDTGGSNEGPLYLQRLRMRKAERVLKKETDFNVHGIPAIDWAEEAQIDEESASRSEERDKHVASNESLLKWNFYANVQLQRLGQNVGERLSSASTKRMELPLPAVADRVEAKYAHGPLEQIEPTRLTELSSSLHSVEDDSLFSLASHALSSSSPVTFTPNTAAALARPPDPHVGKLLRKKFGMPSAPSTSSAPRRLPKPQINHPGVEEQGAVTVSTSQDGPGEFPHFETDERGDLRIVSGTREGTRSQRHSNTVQINDVSATEKLSLNSYGVGESAASGTSPKRLSTEHNGKRIKFARPAANAPVAAESSPRHLSRVGMEEIVFEDVELLCEVRSPPRCLAITGASVLVLLQEEVDSAQSLSWQAFLDFAQAQDLAQLMNLLIPATVPKYKVDIISPHTRELQEASLTDPADGSSRVSAITFEVESAAMKFIHWVIQVVNNASKYMSHVKRSAAVNRQPQAEVAAVPNFVSLNKQKVSSLSKRRAQIVAQRAPTSAMHSASAPEFLSPAVISNNSESPPRLKKSTASQPSLVKIGNKLEVGMDTVMTELVSDIYERPVVLALLAPKAPAATERLQAVVYDPATSLEAKTTIDIGAYKSYRQKLEDGESGPRSSVDVAAFLPDSVQWWVTHLRRVVIVSNGISGDLKVRVSRKAVRRELTKPPEPGTSTATGVVSVGPTDTDSKPERPEQDDPGANGTVSPVQSSAWSFHTEQTVEEIAAGRLGGAKDRTEGGGIVEDRDRVSQSKRKVDPPPLKKRLSAIDRSDAVAKAKAEEDQRRQEAAKKKEEMELKKRQQWEAKAKADREARIKAEEDAKLKQQEESRSQAERVAKLKEEKIAKLKAEKEARLAREAEERLAQQQAKEAADLKAKEDARLAQELVNESDSVRLSGLDVAAVVSREGSGTAAAESLYEVDFLDETAVARTNGEEKEEGSLHLREKNMDHEELDNFKSGSPPIEAARLVIVHPDESASVVVNDASIPDGVDKEECASLPSPKVDGKPLEANKALLHEGSAEDMQSNTNGVESIPILRDHTASPNPAESSSPSATNGNDVVQPIGVMSADMESPLVHAAEEAKEPLLEIKAEQPSPGMKSKESSPEVKSEPQSPEVMSEPQSPEVKSELQSPEVTRSLEPPPAMKFETVPPALSVGGGDGGDGESTVRSPDSSEGTNVTQETYAESDFNKDFEGKFGSLTISERELLDKDSLVGDGDSLADEKFERGSGLVDEDDSGAAGYPGVAITPPSDAKDSIEHKGESRSGGGIKSLERPGGDEEEDYDDDVYSEDTAKKGTLGVAGISAIDPPKGVPVNGSVGEELRSDLSLAVGVETVGAAGDGEEDEDEDYGYDDDFSETESKLKVPIPNVASPVKSGGGRGASSSVGASSRGSGNSAGGEEDDYYDEDEFDSASLGQRSASTPNRAAAVTKGLSHSMSKKSIPSDEDYYSDAFDD